MVWYVCYIEGNRTKREAREMTSTNDKGQVLWGAWCVVCDKYVPEGGPIPNGHWVESAARLHISQTNHRVIVGYQMSVDELPDKHEPATIGGRGRGGERRG